MDKESLIFGQGSVNKLKKSLDQFLNQLNFEEKEAFSMLVGGILDTPIKKIKSIPQEVILNNIELAFYRNLLEIGHPVSSKPFHESFVVIMKATRLCNLRCVYCHSWKEGPNQIMPFRTLSRSIRDAQLIQGVKRVIYVWHGGETTLVPREYYKKAIWLQEQFRKSGQIIENVIQTNGTRLDDEWIEFFKLYNFGIGISLDGPPEVNDKRRVDKKGLPSTQKVVENIKKLDAAKMQYGVLVVVDDEIIELGAARMLEYLSEIGVKGVGLLNAIPENTFEAGVKGTYLQWNKYVTYLTEMFEIWWGSYRDKIVVRELIQLTKAVHKNKPPTSCYHNGNCMGRYITVEPNGDVLACEKYIGDKDFLYGNLFEHNGISELLEKSANFKKSWNNTEESSKKMQKCKWYHNVCRGSCPHDRRLNSILDMEYTGTCCGLKPLLENIDAVIAN